MDFVGRDSIVKMMIKTRQHVAEWKIEIHDVLISEEHTVVLGTNHVTFKHGGTDLDDRLVDVYHIDDEGKIQDIWEFSGGVTWKEYLGRNTRSVE